MAAGTLRGASFAVEAPGAPASCGIWVTAHDDTSASVAAAGILVEPLSNTSANVHAVRVPRNARRVQMRVKHTGTTAVATSPIVHLYSVYNADAQVNSSGWLDNVSTTNSVLRIASAVTLTVATTDIYTRNAANEKVFYSVCPTNAIDSNPWYDIQGGKFVIVLVSTASSTTTASSDTPTVEVNFLD